MFKFYACVICGLLGSSLAQGPLKPRATLYEFTGGTGATFELDTSIYAGELSGYDNKAYAVCLLGTWLFYDDTFFNSAGTARMEYLYEPTFTCHNFQHVPGAVSSARYAGSPQDLTSDTITFYEGTFFQGDEEYTFTDLPNLFLFGSQSSIIITGKSGWTLYDRPEYGGIAVCVFPPASDTYIPAFITNTEELTIPVPHGTIASVRKGCYADAHAVRP